MPRKSFQRKDIETRIVNANLRRSIDKQNRNSFNRKYRSSAYFKFSVGFRILLVFVSVYFLLWDKELFYVRKDVITNCIVEKEETSYKRGKRMVIIANLSMQSGNDLNLDITSSGNGSERFNVGDTLLIGHTIFGKPNYVMKDSNEKYYYVVSRHLTFIAVFLFSGILALVSLFMISGYEWSSRNFVKFTTAALMILLLTYLLL